MRRLSVLGWLGLSVALLVSAGCGGAKAGDSCAAGDEAECADTQRELYCEGGVWRERSCARCFEASGEAHVHRRGPEALHAPRRRGR